MALNSLVDIYNKKGENFVKQLLSLDVTVYEKMDGGNITFENTPKGLVFYKRNSTIPIGNIEVL